MTVVLGSPFIYRYFFSLLSDTLTTPRVEITLTCWGLITEPYVCTRILSHSLSTITLLLRHRVCTLIKLINVTLKKLLINTPLFVLQLVVLLRVEKLPGRVDAKTYGRVK